jgi:uncharacterized membrane protein
MEDYERSTTVDAPPDELFEYLSKVENLPTYMDRMTSARNLPGDEVEVEAKIEPGDVGSDDGGERTVGGDAWFTIDADSKTLTWGSEGPHDYKGQLQVTPAGDAASTVTVKLHTTHQAEGIEDGIEQTLANIANLAGSDGRLNAGAGTS